MGNWQGSTPDVVVIGSGPNGLTAANLLADQGWEVTVIEAASTPGGAVRSGELIEPGFVNDLFSAFYPLGAASPVLNALELDRFGLSWCHAPTVAAHPSLDGSCPVISRNLDETAESFDRYHAGDGDGWRRLYRLWEQVSDPLLEAMLSPFPPVRAGARLAKALPATELVRFARFMLLPVRRLGEEEFGSDAARRMMAGMALHSDLPPEANLSGMFGWLMASLGQSVGFPVPRGGSGQLTAALVRRLEQRGGRIGYEAPATEVVIREGRAVGVRLGGAHDGAVLDCRRAVLADVSAPEPVRATRLVRAPARFPVGRPPALPVGQRHRQGRLDTR